MTIRNNKSNSKLTCLSQFLNTHSRNCEIASNCLLDHSINCYTDIHRIKVAEAGLSRAGLI
jgi:hypothetical protein